VAARKSNFTERPIPPSGNRYGSPDRSVNGPPIVPSKRREGQVFTPKPVDTTVKRRPTSTPAIKPIRDSRVKRVNPPALLPIKRDEKKSQTPAIQPIKRDQIKTNAPQLSSPQSNRLESLISSLVNQSNNPLKKDREGVEQKRVYRPPTY